jgi:hypothetical protein
MSDPRDLTNRLDEGHPSLALRRDDLAPLRGDAVIAPAASAVLDPSAFDPAAPLEAIEQRVERGSLEAQRAIRSTLDS